MARKEIEWKEGCDDFNIWLNELQTTAVNPIYQDTDDHLAMKWKDPEYTDTSSVMTVRLVHTGQEGDMPYCHEVIRTSNVEDHGDEFSTPNLTHANDYNTLNPEIGNNHVQCNPPSDTHNILLSAEKESTEYHIDENAQMEQPSNFSLTKPALKKSPLLEIGPTSFTEIPPIQSAHLESAVKPCAEKETQTTYVVSGMADLTHSNNMGATSSDGVTVTPLLCHFTTNYHKEDVMSDEYTKIIKDLENQLKERNSEVKYLSLHLSVVIVL